MAESNNPDDQKERSWAEKLREMFDMEVKGTPIKSAEDAVEDMRKTGNRMPRKKIKPRNQ